MRSSACSSSGWRRPRDVALNAAYQNPRALSFIVGRQLAYLRGGNLVRFYIGLEDPEWLIADLKQALLTL